MRFIYFLLMMMSTNQALASTSYNPWIPLVMPQFFKNNYAEDLESPLVDIFNDTGTNLCLLVNKKPTVADFKSRVEAWNMATEGKAQPPENVYLSDVEAFLQKNLPEESASWKYSIEDVRRSIKAQSEWWNSQPLPCGEHEKGINDFFSFIKSMDLKEKEKAQYLSSRLRLSQICTLAASTQNEETPQMPTEEIKAYVSWLQEMIQKSTLKERISDYLTALAESYGAMASSLPIQRQKALTKTNIEYIRDSFTYYVTRKLAADTSSEDVSSISKVILPELESKFSSEKTGSELWQQYIRDFPNGRFIKSARGMLRRHSANYVEEFEKFLAHPATAPLSDFECERLAQEIETHINLYSEGMNGEDGEKSMLNSPYLMTITTFQKFRYREYGWVRVFRALSGKSDSSERPEQLKNYDQPGAPSARRQALYSPTGSADPILRHLDTNKGFKQHPQLRDLMKALVFYQNENYEKILKLPISDYKENKAIYLSLLRFKAWAHEAQGKFPEALDLWKEIKNGVLLPKIELISADVPILENYILAKKWDFAWNDFAAQPKVLAIFLSRYATDEFILKGLEDKNLNEKIREATVSEFLNRSLVTQHWHSLLQLKAVVPETSKKLPPKIWTAIEKLAKQQEDPTSLLIVAQHLLTQGKFIEDYSENFGTFTKASFIFKPENAGDIYLKVLGLTEKLKKSSAEAEALSHLSKCLGREYERDYYCRIDPKKYNDKTRKAWFKKLHKKYSRSTWAKKTPYFY